MTDLETTAANTLEESPDVVGRAFSDHQAIACQAAGRVDQGRGGRPAGLVEHGVVQ